MGNFQIKIEVFAFRHVYEILFILTQAIIFFMYRVQITESIVIKNND